MITVDGLVTLLLKLGIDVGGPFKLGARNGVVITFDPEWQVEFPYCALLLDEAGAIEQEGYYATFNELKSAIDSGFFSR